MNAIEQNRFLIVIHLAHAKKDRTRIVDTSLTEAASPGGCASEFYGIGVGGVGSCVGYKGYVAANERCRVRVHFAI